jgi:hypothetical protein
MKMQGRKGFSMAAISIGKRKCTGRALIGRGNRSKNSQNNEEGRSSTKIRLSLMSLI